ncbi:hypothetical protein [Thiovibrio frasassiensis]|uniref:Uncharacterized protein n=1 Tax=Thiovibrio frasassiensis TaxID=2984131 RepID=A0A9X4MIF2_9BACT|nr:hypothetical protein [Thiovibrio frasassiensis]MDG4476455.1 hypothetical protein [Thiovibrio frasassiensis]
MCPEYLAPLANRRGIALVTAIFAIVILALFGLLITRYTITTQTSSAEDYLWGQALYSAESTLRLNILGDDGGGGIAAPVIPTVGGLTTEFPPDGPAFAFSAPGTNVTIRVRGFHGTGISRTVEANYKL